MDIQEYIQSGIIESYVLGLATAEEIKAGEMDGGGGQTRGRTNRRIT